MRLGSAGRRGHSRRKPDLLFLDVQMPECGGFDVLELLGTDLPQTIIFVTAHDEYALRAFEAGALDYLLEPVDDARLMRALARAQEKIAHYASHQQAPRRLVVKAPRRLLFIDVSVIRIHRSTIVNLERVGGRELQSSGEYAVVLRAGIRLRLSRRYRQALQSRLDCDAVSRLA